MENSYSRSLTSYLLCQERQNAPYVLKRKYLIKNVCNILYTYSKFLHPFRFIRPWLKTIYKNVNVPNSLSYKRYSLQSIKFRT